MPDRRITGMTRIYGLMGDPVEHSVSPAMQNAAFEARGLDAVYLPFKVKSQELQPAIQGIRALNIQGLNVTIPHKVAVIPFLDELDPLAENIGAVNTIVNEEDSLKGFNTDASGFLKALLSEGIQPERKNVVILGAGGAARAIAFILADRGANLIILNRHIEAAQDLADRIVNLFRREVQALEMKPGNLQTALKSGDIIVNTTSVGMSPGLSETPVPPSLIQRGQVVFDIIYNPVRTRLMDESKKRGAKVIGGVEMLVQQGAAAYEHWTGQEAPIEVMRQAALKALEEPDKRSNPD